MAGLQESPIPGVAVTIDPHAVRITSESPLAVLSSAVVGGGVTRVREIVNVHVDDKYDGGRPEDDLDAWAGARGVGKPFVGLMTAAYTQFSRVAVESLDGIAVAAVVSVGLSNTTRAGVTPPIGAGDGARAKPGTINVILLVDGALTPAAMVNAVITATEAKTITLAEWDARTPDGELASGTSTDTVVVACTDRGGPLPYAGPATTVGWLCARTFRQAMTTIFREKVAREGGRTGW